MQRRAHGGGRGTPPPTCQTPRPRPWTRAMGRSCAGSTAVCRPRSYFLGACRRSIVVGEGEGVVVAGPDGGRRQDCDGSRVREKWEGGKTREHEGGVGIRLARARRGRW